MLERCSRIHGAEGIGTYERPVVRVTTYAEGQGRQPRMMEAAELLEWLK